jgi:phosphohistidine phosphatase
MPGPYELYLVRHGVAEERGAKWPDDAKRPLSADGMSRMKKSARGLDRLDVTFDVILTSPLVRARQTADILSAEMDGHPAIVNVEALAPGASYASLVTELEKHARKARIALVGHEPGIGELAARLVGSRHPIEFKKGSVARIDVEQIPPAGPGDLRWMMPPKFMRAMKKS